MKIFQPASFLFLLLSVTGLSAQEQPPEQPHLDKILEQRTFTPGEEDALDLGGGGVDGTQPDDTVDVRDLVIFLDGLPITAKFKEATSYAFRDQGSVRVDVIFSKPATGSIRFALGGTASLGEDYLAFGEEVAGFEGITVEEDVVEAISLTLDVPIPPTNGEFAGERRLTLSLMGKATIQQSEGALAIDRDGGISPGSMTNHTIVIRDAAKAWTGTMEFSREAGLASSAVRFLMDEEGSTALIVQDSAVFSDVTAFQATVEGEGKLNFMEPSTNNRSVITGRYSIPGDPQSEPVAWELSFSNSPTNPEDFSEIATYTGTLTRDNFPVSGVSQTNSVTLTLVAEN